MSINPLSPQERLRATQALAALRAAKAAPAPASDATVRQPDDVKISDAARALAAGRDNVDASSIEREDRLAAIKAAIANGSYNVSSRDLARSMLKSGDIEL
jgi:negative regulator of flagellin synthesis FlgM